MSHPTTIPIFFLAFADAKQYGHLPNLGPEYNALFDLLLPLKKARQLDLLREYHSENKTIPKRLAEFKDQIHIFHYSGHADGKHLFFDDKAGHSKGLAELLALQRSLKLVFLNGCRSQAQAEQYIATGVPAVIATTSSIRDEEARYFAECFYRALANRHNIQEAFQAASGALKTESGKYDEQKGEITVLRDIVFDDAFKNDLPWHLYIRAGQEAILDWIIPEVVPQEHTVTLLVANSETYQQIRKRIEGLEQQIREKREQIQAFPSPLPEALVPVLKSLEVEQINLGSALEEAMGQERQFKEGVIKLAETFQHIELNTERLKKAKAHFDANEYDKARAVLKEEEMQAELEVLLEQKERLESKASENEQNLRDKANEFLILAKITAVDFELPGRFEKTKGYFEQSLKAWETEDNLFEYAYFLQKHNQILAAFPLYEKALAKYRQLAETNPKIYLPDVAQSLNNLAALQGDKNEFAESEKYFLEALAIRRELAKSDPQTYLPDVAGTLNNLAVLKSKNTEFRESEKFFLEALAIRRKLASSNPQTYLPDVAEILNNFGILKKTKNEFGESEKFFLEALAIRRKLASSNPQTYQPDVAVVLNNLGRLQSVKNELAQAENSYEEALGIRRELAESNPQSHLPYVANTLNNLGLLQNAKKDFIEAEKSYEEALSIYLKLAEVNPQTYLPDVANTQINLSRLFQDSILDKERSMGLVKDAIQNLKGFKDIPYVQSYLEEARQVLEKWEVSLDKLFEEE